ncbi:MAG: hypothetical protein COX62_01145, partial [Deltaproteobacteria bacterium CG_4_10_14_0_2_um_filter_43_8]
FADEALKEQTKKHSRRIYFIHTRKAENMPAQVKWNCRLFSSRAKRFSTKLMKKLHLKVSKTANVSLF